MIGITAKIRREAIDWRVRRYAGACGDDRDIVFDDGSALFRNYRAMVDHAMRERKRLEALPDDALWAECVREAQEPHRGTPPPRP